MKTSMKKFISLCLTVVFLLTSVVLPGAAPAMAEETTVNSGSGSALLELDNKPPENMANVKNPYGYEEDVAFAMSVSSELLYFGGEDGDKHTHVFNGESFDSLKSFVNAPNKGSGSYKLPDGTWNWVQAVAFDSSEDSARDNQVLFVGVKEDGQCAYAWVLNYDNGKNTIIGPTKIGEMSWIGNKYEMYTSTTLLEVTAGDFDGDGVDSLLVYAPLNLDSSNSDGCSLFELKYDGSSLKLGGKGNHLLMDTYMNDQASKKYKDQHAAGEDDRDKLAVSMQVADFNGDTIDDLAVLSYSHNRSRGGSTAYYSPELNICYGGSSATDISKLKANATYYATGSENGKHIFPLGACLAAGDYNGDGYDDLYVTGVKATYNNGIEIDEEKWYLQSWYGKLDDAMSGGFYTTTESNEWFQGGFYTDDTRYSKVMSAGVAISGHAAPEMLFICGSLYDVSSGAAARAIKDDKGNETGYFSSKDQGLNSVTCTNTYVQSVAVGNFDNNDAGREQVVFVLGLKERGADDYWFMSGCIGGTDFNDTTASDGTVSYGAATGYYRTDMDDEANYIHTNKGDDIDEGLNCLLIALDYDHNDGIMAKYRGATYVYSDPQVRAVLQAAPYFGDVSDGSGNETGYTLTTSYVKEDSKGHSTNFTAGGIITGGAGFVPSYTVELGFQHSWDKNVTSIYETTYVNRFFAGAYDTVVVNRIPLIVYQYEIADEEGNFKDNGYYNMQFTLPKEPVWEQMSVAKYNQFVEEYNAVLNACGKLGDAKNSLYLKKIDEKDNWLDGNEGNPYAYNHAGWPEGRRISDSSNQLGHNGGGVEITWDENNATNIEMTNAYGFYVGGSVAFGVDAFAGGPALSLDYARSIGEAECKGSAIGSQCIVTNLDGTNLKKQGMDDATLEQYRFTWTFGEWYQDLGMRMDDAEDEDNDGVFVETVYTPFIGYSVTDISSPPRAVSNLTAQAENGGIRLNWDVPETPEGWPEINGYAVYQITDGAEKLIQTVEDGSANNCVINGLNANNSYTFCVRSYYVNDAGQKIHSAASNHATAYTKCEVVADYDSDNLTMEIDGETITTGQPYYYDGGSKLNIEAKTTTGSYMLFSLGMYPTGIYGAKMESAISEDGGNSVSAEYTVNRNVGITAYGAEKVDKMRLYFADTVKDIDGTTAGKVSASVSNTTITNGAGVSEKVTFLATPESGYQFGGWDVTVDEHTLHFVKQNLTIPPIANEVTVNAVFKSSEEKYLIKVEQPDEGGSILVTDTSGNELEPLENGSYYVPTGTQMVFTVQPQVGYVISAWTGAAVGHDSETFTLQVTEDTTVGAILRAPVTYPVTYNEADAHGNRVTAEPNIESGIDVAAGTPVTFTAQAADGYRIDGWTVTRGTDEAGTDEAEVTHYTKEENLTTDSFTEVIQNVTAVEASFVPMEQYTIAVNQAGQGNITITSDGKTLANGNKVSYTSDVTLLAKPEEGWKMTSVGNWVELADGSYMLVLDDVDSHHSIEVVFKEASSLDEDNGYSGSGGGFYFDSQTTTSDDALTVKELPVSSDALRDAEHAAKADSDVQIVGGSHSAVQITAEKNGTPVASLEQPVKVTVPLSSQALQTVKNVNNLSLALVTVDENGRVVLDYVGGSYNRDTHTFTAYAAYPGNYVLAEKDDIIKIELTIGSRIAQVNDIDVRKDTHSRIVNNRTMVPLRFVGEQLNCEVQWDGKTRTVTVCTDDGQTLRMTIDEIIPGFGAAPIICDGRTLVPIAYIARNLDANVMWIAEEQQVIIVK